MVGGVRVLTQKPARWLPSEVIRATPAGPAVGWMYLEQERFLRPFLIDDCQEAMRRPANAVFRPQTSLAELRALADDVDAAPLSGMIFHVSRCGSTLLSQTLARSANTLVLSEPRALDALLRINDTGEVVSRDELIGTLRALVRLMGRRRFDDQARVFIKLDAWHLLYAPLLLEAFPNTPRLTLYRDPLEVMVSQQRQRGIFMASGYLDRSRLGLAADEHPAPNDYAATVLEALYAGALALNPGGERLMNYSELPAALSDRLPAFFSFDADQAYQDAVARSVAVHAKRGEPFAPDAEQKREEADPDMVRVIDARVRPLYEALEGRRKAKV